MHIRYTKPNEDSGGIWRVSDDLLNQSAVLFFIHGEYMSAGHPNDKVKLDQMFDKGFIAKATLIDIMLDSEVEEMVFLANL